VDYISIIQAITRSLIGLIVVGGGLYLLASRTPIPTEAWGVAAVVIGALFGVEAIAKVFRAKQ
jgi:hypothetical protein